MSRHCLTMKSSSFPAGLRICRPQFGQKIRCTRGKVSQFMVTSRISRYASLPQKHLIPAFTASPTRRSRCQSSFLFTTVSPPSAHRSHCQVKGNHQGTSISTTTNLRIGVIERTRHNSRQNLQYFCTQSNQAFHFAAFLSSIQIHSFIVLPPCSGCLFY